MIPQIQTHQRANGENQQKGGGDCQKFEKQALLFRQDLVATQCVLNRCMIFRSINIVACQKSSGGFVYGPFPHASI
jgi:hypothetical protein